MIFMYIYIYYRDGYNSPKNKGTSIVESYIQSKIDTCWIHSSLFQFIPVFLVLIMQNSTVVHSADGDEKLSRTWFKNFSKDERKRIGIGRHF